MWSRVAFFPVALLAGCGFSTETPLKEERITEEAMNNRIYVRDIAYVGAVNRTSNAKFVSVSPDQMKDERDYNRVTYSYLNNDNYFSAITSKINLKEKIVHDDYYENHFNLKRFHAYHRQNSALRGDRSPD